MRPLLRPNLLWRLLRFVMRVLARIGGLDVVGASNVPVDAPVVLVASHRSNADIPYLGLASPRPVNFMARHDLFDWGPFGLLGRMLRHCGALPVERGRTDTAALRASTAVLRAGGVLGLFPEGHFGTGDRLDALQPGAAWLAVRTGAVVVPVGIGGTARVQPPLSGRVHRARVRVVFGAPIAPPPFDAGGRSAAVEALTDDLAGALQAAFDAAGGSDGPG